MSSLITDRLNFNALNPPKEVSPGLEEKSQSHETLAPSVANALGTEALGDVGVTSPASHWGSEYVSRLKGEETSPTHLEFDNSRSVGEAVAAIGLEVEAFLEELETGTKKSLQDLKDAYETLTTSMQPGGNIKAGAKNLAVVLQGLGPQLEGQDMARVDQKRRVDTLTEYINEYIGETKRKDQSSEEFAREMQDEHNYLTGLGETLSAMDMHNADADVTAKTRAIELAIEELNRYARGEYIDDRGKLTEYLASTIDAVNGIADVRKRALGSLRLQIENHRAKGVRKQEDKPTSTITSRLSGL